ncbi:MAG: hypothetical protein ACFFDF_23780 [Candidatus Odinarchaeota archaeon]
MSENNQNEDVFDVSYEIHVNDLSKEVIKFLKEHNIPFQAWRIYNLKEKYNSPDEEIPLVEVDTKIYQKLLKLSEITGIPIKKIVSEEFKTFFFSVGDQIAVFLDRHLDIRNMENPIKIIRNLKDLLKISDFYLESLKTKEDLIKEIDEFNRI